MNFFFKLCVAQKKNTAANISVRAVLVWQTRGGFSFPWNDQCRLSSSLCIVQRVTARASVMLAPGGGGGGGGAKNYITY